MSTTTYQLVSRFRNASECPNEADRLRRQVVGFLNNCAELLNNHPPCWQVRVQRTGDRYDVTVANIPIAVAPPTIESLVVMAAKSVTCRFILLPARVPTQLA